MIKEFGDFLYNFESALELKSYKEGYKICTVKSLTPLTFEFEGVEIGKKLGDTIYIHPLFISNLINQDEESLGNSQFFNSTTAYNSPTFQGIIEGTIPDFLKDFYLFYKNWQSIFLLKEGDLVAMVELGENKYLVLQKIDMV